MRRVVVFSALLGLVALFGKGDMTAEVSTPFLLATQNGDVNASGEIDISDPVYLLSYLYLGGPAPVPLYCEPAVEHHNGDVNGDGNIDQSDAVHMLMWLFLGGESAAQGRLNPPVGPGF